MISFENISIKDAMTFVVLPAVAYLLCLQAVMPPIPVLLPRHWNFFLLTSAVPKKVVNYLAYLSLLLLLTGRMVYVVYEELRKLRGTNGLTTGHKFFSVCLTIIFSIGLIWPVLLQLVYFLSPYYYPWAVASAVIAFCFESSIFKFISWLFDKFRKPQTKQCASGWRHTGIKQRASAIKYMPWLFGSTSKPNWTQTEQRASATNQSNVEQRPSVPSQAPTSSSYPRSERSGDSVPTEKGENSGINAESVLRESAGTSTAEESAVGETSADISSLPSTAPSTSAAATTEMGGDRAKSSTRKKQLRGARPRNDVKKQVHAALLNNPVFFRRTRSGRIYGPARH